MTSDRKCRVYWLGDAGNPLPGGFDATALSRPFDLRDAAPREPAVFVIDLRGDVSGTDPISIRSVLGQRHVIVAVVEALGADAAVPLYDADIDDVIDAAALAQPGPILARARSRLRLRERADREARRARFLQAALNNLPVPVFFKDVKGAYQGCNAAFERYIGLERDAIVGHTVYDIAPRELAVLYEKADNDLFARGGTQTYESNVRYADGSVHDVIFHKAAFDDAEGRRMGLAGAMLDITTRKQLEAELRTLAEQDPLTGLPNRRKFFSLAAHLRENAHTAPTPNWILVIDVDHFKSINDRFGHAMGDDVLKHVARTLQRTLRTEDVIARSGGEEFFAMLAGIELDECLAAAEDMRAAVERVAPLVAEGLPTVTVSIGIGPWCPAREHVEAAIRRADAQMYRAKHGGRNCVMTAIEP